MTRSFKAAIHPVDVLLIEDNTGDVRLTREGLKDAAVPIQLHVVADGEAAMSFLLREGTYATAPRPHLILLDLKLSKRDGREVLKDIKENAALSGIPVVVQSIDRFWLSTVRLPQPAAPA